MNTDSPPVYHLQLPERFLDALKRVHPILGDMIDGEGNRYPSPELCAIYYDLTVCSFRYQSFTTQQIHIFYSALTLSIFAHHFSPEDMDYHDPERDELAILLNLMHPCRWKLIQKEVPS